MKHISILLLLILALTSCSKTTDVIKINKEKIELPIEIICESSDKSKITIKRDLRYIIKNTSVTSRILACEAIHVSKSGFNKGLSVIPEFEDSVYSKHLIISEISGKSNRSYLVKPSKILSFPNLQDVFQDEEPDSIYYSDSQNTVKIFRYSDINKLPKLVQLLVEDIYKGDSIRFTFVDEALPFYIKKDITNYPQISRAIRFSKLSNLDSI